jgi:SAM-dependent methyltransferase
VPAPQDYFRTRFTPHEARSAVWTHLARYLQRWVPADGAVVDLGAGYADFLAHVAARRKVAVDLHPDLAAMVPAGVEAVIGDVTDLGGFPDGSFDAAFASNLLEHLEWPAIERLLDEVRRVLVPGGHLILVQPNFRLAPRQYFDDFTHRTIFTDRSLADLLGASGFEVDHVEPRFLPLTMKSRLAVGHRLVPWYLRLPYRPLAGQMLVVAHRP